MRRELVSGDQKPSTDLSLELGQQTFTTGRDLRYHVVPFPFFIVKKSKMWIIEKTTELSRPEDWNGSLSLLEGMFPTQVCPRPGIEPRSPALQADSLPAEPPGKPKKLEWVAHPFSSRSSHSQELNRGLLHCRWILLPAELPGKPESHHGTHHHTRQPPASVLITSELTAQTTSLSPYLCDTCIKQWEILKATEKLKGTK